MRPSRFVWALLAVLVALAAAGCTHDYSQFEFEGVNGKAPATDGGLDANAPDAH